MNNSLIATVTRPGAQTRSRWRRKPTAKIKKVARVIVDQAVFCRACSDPMHLMPNHVFACSHCGHQIAAEDAIEAIETARPNRSQDFEAKIRVEVEQRQPALLQSLNLI